MIQFKVQKLS